MFRGWLAGSGKDVEENYAKMTNLEHKLPDRNQLYQPCLLVCCGSNSIIMLVCLNTKADLILFFKLTIARALNMILELTVRVVTENGQELQDTRSRSY